MQEGQRLSDAQVDLIAKLLGMKPGTREAVRAVLVHGARVRDVALATHLLPQHISRAVRRCSEEHRLIEAVYTPKSQKPA